MLASTNIQVLIYIRGIDSIEHERSECEMVKTARANKRVHIFRTSERQQQISGGDALRGHTRSHPEHDG